MSESHVSMDQIKDAMDQYEKAVVNQTTATLMRSSKGLIKELDEERKVARLVLTCLILELSHQSSELIPNPSIQADGDDVDS